MWSSTRAPDTRGVHGPPLGVVAPPVHAVAARAKALLWPAVATTRGDPIPRCPASPPPRVGTSSSATAPTGTTTGSATSMSSGGPAPCGLLGLDHVGVSVRADQLNEEVGFLRTLFDLRPGPVQEFIEPHGRLRSRALRPPSGDLRFVLNVEDGQGAPHRTGINQVALRTDDAVAAVDALRSAGVPLMPVPDNYYVDLHARFDLDPDFSAAPLTHFSTTVSATGELLHAYTPVLATGFYVELLERRGGYDGYGSAGTHVRLAAQSATSGTT